MRHVKFLVLLLFSAANYCCWTYLTSFRHVPIWSLPSIGHFSAFICLFFLSLNSFKPSIKFRDARQVIEHEIAARKAKDARRDKKCREAQGRIRLKRLEKDAKIVAKVIGPELMSVIQISESPTHNGFFIVRAPGFKDIATRVNDNDICTFEDDKSYYYTLQAALDANRIEQPTTIA